MEHVAAENWEALLRQQESLRAVIESISRELDLPTLLTRIVRDACELTGADHGTIGLVDDEGRWVRTQAVYQMPPNELGSRTGPGIGLAGQVLLTRKTVILKRYGSAHQPTQPDMLDDAVIGIPIFWQDRLTGVFGIGFSPPNRFGEGAVEILSQFARHAAIAIENARRYAQEHRRAERFALIARIGSIVTADLHLDELLQRVADAIHERLGYPNVAIPLIDPQEPEMMILSIFGGQYKEFMEGEYRLPISHGIMGAAARERVPILVNDVASDPRHLPTPGAVGITAELTVPILLGDRLLGVLNVESGSPFNDEDTVSLQVVADQLAVAIENARLYEQGQQVAVLQERHRLARELHDSVTQILFSILLIAQTLGPAWQRNPAEGEGAITRLLELSRTALTEMRGLLQELRPSAAGEPSRSNPAQMPTLEQVQHLGLVAVLAAHAADVSRHGQAVHFDASGYQPQVVDQEQALFRIAQEAMGNAVKHAAAKNIWVRLQSNEETASLTVSDDGRGFVPDALSAKGAVGQGGMGLNLMRERAEERGGTTRIISGWGQGTRIEVTLPACENQEQA